GRPLSHAKDHRGPPRRTQPMSRYPKPTFKPPLVGHKCGNYKVNHRLTMFGNSALQGRQAEYRFGQVAEAGDHAIGLELSNGNLGITEIDRNYWHSDCAGSGDVGHRIPDHDHPAGVAAGPPDRP